MGANKSPDPNEKGDTMLPDPRLGHLLAYTTFHIGLYMTAGAALIAAIHMEHPLVPTVDYAVRFAIVMMFAAGICGGVIGSNIPDHKTYDAFSGKEIGRFGFKRKSDFWIRWEHVFFWSGALPLPILFVVLGKGAWT